MSAHKIRKLLVRAPGGSYPVWIGRGAWKQLSRALTSGQRPFRLHIVSDSRVWRHHGQAVSRILEKSGLPMSRTVVRAGESSKSSGELERIWRAAIQSGVDRQSCVVAFGGGVVGDLGGVFATSVFNVGADRR